MSDRYKKCPLTEAGFKLIKLDELPPMIIGADGKCICTADQRCMDVDKRDGQRCTLWELERLSNQASARRSYQSGED